MSKQIIMTSPVSFSVKYDINPHMTGNEGTVNLLEAVKQWNNLRNALVSMAAVDVIVMPDPGTSCPDAVFTANAGLIYKNKFIPSRFKHLERQTEEPYFINYFWEHSFNIITNYGAHSFEGAGDALFDKFKGILWYGFGFRSSFAFKEVLDREFENTDIIVRPLELVDSRWYHLDTCFCPLDTGELLWYPKAFSAHSQYTIESWYGDKAIAVSEVDALGFACNAVSANKHLITPLISDELDGILMGRGYLVEQVEMSEFIKSGGACKCLTLEVN